MRVLVFATALCAVGLMGLRAEAGPLVTNGSLEQTTTNNGGTVPGSLCYYGSFNSCSSETGWTNTNSYSFIGNAANPTNLGTGPYGNVTLSAATASPDGGNFIAVDGDQSVTNGGGLLQTINNLVVGDNYAVTFYQAGAEQNKKSSPTTEQWQVSLGGTTLLSTLMNDPAGGFTGWMLQTLVFNATSTSEILDFVALGGPSGQPPFVLLDGVGMTDVPEPSAYLLVGAALAGLVMFRRRTRTA